jgi:hypothetical protein
MVNAIVPTPTHAELYIPGYHLQFCKAVKELPGDCVPRIAEKVARHSLEYWRDVYLRGPGVGLVCVPEEPKVWHFIDWARHAHNRHDSSGAPVEHPMECNAALNAMWKLTCDAWGLPHGLDIAAFRTSFELDGGFVKMTARDTEPSVHATTYAILANLCTDVAASGRALLVLLDEWAGSLLSPSDLDHGGPTVYFSAYVVDALKHAGYETEALVHVERVYGPWARKYGTLIEKKLPTASLAHAWSVGVARHIVESSAL